MSYNPGAGINQKPKNLTSKAESDIYHNKANKKYRGSLKRGETNSDGADYREETSRNALWMKYFLKWARRSGQISIGAAGRDISIKASCT